jgi:hypothetical protein
MDWRAERDREKAETRERRLALAKQRRDEEAKIRKAFESNLKVELGIADHPKADRLIQIAWDLGHSSGLHEVRMYAEQLVDLLS